MFVRSRNYANVTATLALVIALGGTSYAAVTVTGGDVKDGSLTGRDIKNNSLHSGDIQGIRSWDIQTGAVKSSDIANHSIRAEDLAASALHDSSKGDTGATGAKGDKGAAGTGGSSVVNRTRSAGPVTPTANNTATAVPLTDNSWTQRAGEIDQLFGSANITVPASCNSPMTDYGHLTVSVSVNGGPAAEVGTVSVYGSPAGSTVEVPVSFSRATLFEPGSAAATTFTGEFSNSCAAGNMTLNSVKLDVIGTL